MHWDTAVREEEPLQCAVPPREHEPSTAAKQLHPYYANSISSYFRQIFHAWVLQKGGDKKEKKEKKIAQCKAPVHT